jgi:hypothetical protein
MFERGPRSSLDAKPQWGNPPALRGPAKPAQLLENSARIALHRPAQDSFHDARAERFPGERG